jgi:predicted acylesterase/phospholipase RssA
MFHHLVISGGASKTIAVVGALEYLEQRKLIEQVKTFVGTSAGAILSFLLVLDFTTKEITSELVENFLGKDVHKLDIDSVLNLTILETFGIDDGNKLESWLRDVLQRKLQRSHITFIDLVKATGKHLVVCVANITKRTSEYFSVDTEPEMDVVLSLRMSAGIPLIYTPVKYKDSFYVDGGIFESFPVFFFDRHKDALKDTLAINTTTLQKHEIATTFTEYLGDLLSSMYEKANTIKKISEKIVSITIEFEHDMMLGVDFENMKFPIDNDYIDKAKKLGYDTIKKHFD